MARDLDKYRKYIDHFDLSEENKTALLEALWNITGSFADQAFGLDPLQQVELRKSQKNLRGDWGLVNYQNQSKTSKKEGRARPPANDNNNIAKDVSNR